MRRLIFAVLVLSASTAVAKPKKKHVAGPYGASSRVVRSAEASGESSLRVRSIDFGRHLVVVELTGFAKAPAGNLFYFVDDRGRRFIATGAHCDDPFPSGIRVCDLTTPDGYERHPWVGLDLHTHGLESKSVVSAPKEEVERAYEAAKSLADVPPGEAKPDPKIEVKPAATDPKSAEPEEEDGDGAEEEN